MTKDEMLLVTSFLDAVSLSKVDQIPPSVLGKIVTILYGPEKSGADQDGEGLEDNG